MNEAYSRAAYLIIQSDGRMQWDDANHTNQPVAYANLVEDQQDYNVFDSAPTALQDWLQIQRVEILDEDGNAVLLKPIDFNEVGEAMTEYEETSGDPEEFNFNGTSLFLYPAPDYDKTAGLIIYFNRAPSYFVSTDTTKKPGFATLLHPYLSIYAAHQWKMIKLNDYSLQPLIEKWEQEISYFYSKRPRYEVPTISRKKISWK